MAVAAERIFENGVRRRSGWRRPRTGSRRAGCGKSGGSWRQYSRWRTTHWRHRGRHERQRTEGDRKRADAEGITDESPIMPDASPSAAVPPKKRSLRIEIAPKTLYSIVALVLGLALITQLVPVILVLVVALMLVGTLNPAVEALEKRKIKRAPAIFAVFGARTGQCRRPAGVHRAGHRRTGGQPDQAGAATARQAGRLPGGLSADRLAGQHGAQFSHTRPSSNPSAARPWLMSRDLLEIVAYGAGAFFLAPVHHDRPRPPARSPCSPPSRAATTSSSRASCCAWK